MGKVTEENDGFIKLLIDQKKEKDLGCNFIGTNASILIHQLLVVMRSKKRKGSICDINSDGSCICHTALSEVAAREDSSV